MRERNGADENPIDIAAAEWFVVLDNPEVSPEEMLAWQDWMQSDTRHARAFARMEEISQALRYARSPAPQKQWALAHDRYDGSVPLDAWRSSPPRRTFALAAAVLLTVALAGTIVLLSPPPRNGMGNVLTTAVGENRSVILKDGSTVTLGGDTRIEMAFDTHTRGLKLERGEAFFTVAKDAMRPFTVRTGGAAVTAVGTSFNIRKGSTGAVIAVTEGRVLVEPESRLFRSAPAVHLDAGEQTTAGKTGITAAVPVDDMATALAWRNGTLAFRLQPLRYVLEDVNRYSPRPIATADDSIGGLTVTGTVSASDIDEWLGSLEQAFGLQAVEEAHRIVLRRVY